jgi:cell division protein ZapA (FtsZ GTPase activity inhibitor)
MSDAPTVSITISMSGQSFRIRVHPEEQAFYEEVARYAESAFEEISRQAVTGGPQAWAMTAFQLARELFEQRGRQAMSDEERARINRMIERIEKVTLRS